MQKGALHSSAVISIIPLDLNWTGRPRSIAAALLRDGSMNAIVDPGPASTLETLRRQLSDHGLRVSDLNYIFLTHIHLDHAAAAGGLVKENPNLKVFVHSRGAAHMADPSKLLHSAGKLYGDKMDFLFGECLPIPEARIEVIRGGEVLPFESSTLQVIYTPGHASHHVTYFEPTQGTAFVGDTTGVCIEGHPLVLPAAPPPDIDLELWNNSLDAIERLQARNFFLTHYGFSNNPVQHLARYRIRLRLWSDISAKILAMGMEESAAIEEFAREVSEEAEPLAAPEDVQHYKYNGQLPLSWMGLSRYHRKRVVAHAS